MICPTKLKNSLFRVNNFRVAVKTDAAKGLLAGFFLGEAQNVGGLGQRGRLRGSDLEVLTGRRRTANSDTTAPEQHNTTQHNRNNTTQGNATQHNNTTQRNTTQRNATNTTQRTARRRNTNTTQHQHTTQHAAQHNTGWLGVYEL